MIAKIILSIKGLLFDNGVMKEINVRELNTYLDVFSTEEDPAIIIANDGKRTNGMTIGWASYGILWNKYSATIYINKKRYSKEIFDEADYFSICYMKKENKDAVKYFGIVSGRDEDKMTKCGLEISNDLAPYFANSRITIICRKMGQSDFDIDHVDPSVTTWYKRDGVHTLYYGEIIKVLVEE